MPPATGPVARIRARVAAGASEELAARLPRRYSRWGSVILLDLPEELRPSFPRIGAEYAREFGAAAVLRRTGPVEGEYRQPRVERIFGDRTETEVIEHGVRYRFDAARIMFARGNKTERARAGTLCRPKERVVDLFAGIGYFVLPAARADPTIRALAVEANPISYQYLLENIARNGLADRVTAVRGDNRQVELPWGEVDRVFLGYLPSSVPWLALAVRLLRPEGGHLHVHLVAESGEANSSASAAVADALRGLGIADAERRSRAVKPYGPGRTHCVVDVALHFGGAARLGNPFEPPVVLAPGRGRRGRSASGPVLPAADRSAGGGGVVRASDLPHVT